MSQYVGYTLLLYSAAVVTTRLFAFEYISLADICATVVSVVAVATLAFQDTNEALSVPISGLNLLAMYLVWKHHVRGTEPRKEDMRGMVCIITGCNSGIGVETARNLAKMGAQVIMACRNMKSGEAVRLDILNSTGNSNVQLLELDLGDFDSVRSFVAHVEGFYSKVDVLINNAGVMTPSRGESKQGIEMMMQTNFLAPFLLTLLLVPMLHKSKCARIVMVSSTMHRFTCLQHGGFDFDDMFSKSDFGMFKSYGQSKLAIELFKFEFNRRLREAGSHIVINSLNPGSIKTSISKDWHWILANGHELIQPLLKTPVSGAYTTTYVATNKSLRSTSGKWFENSKIVQQTTKASDPQDAKRLFDLAEKLVNFEIVFNQNHIK